MRDLLPDSATNRFLAGLRLLVIGGGASLLTGCFGLGAFFYSGDGDFSDHGFSPYGGRYEIDLGPIDSSVAGSHTFKLSGMPRAEFRVEIDVIDQETYRPHFEPPRTTFVGEVGLELTDKSGNVIIDERVPIDNLHRNYGPHVTNSIYAKRGKTIEVPVSERITKTTRVGVKASGGWGTLFESRPGETYHLKVDVLAPIQPTVPTRISLRGSDWP